LRSLDAHLARAADSAAYFGFRFDESTARTALEAHLADEQHAIARLRCYRDGIMRVEIQHPTPDLRNPVRLAVDREPIRSEECWPQHSTSVRDVYTSRLKRHPKADDVVVVNDRLDVVSSCRANLAVCLDNTWWTPPSGSGCLPGVERAELLRAGYLRERRLHLAELVEAQGIALISSAHGWRDAVLEEPLC
jgi:para-aminobenzoate synthetase/4-amino-4-deoxychorismate lyase